MVTRLWDSWDDDAVVVDKEGGVFIDDTRVHPIDHRGDRFAVAGPLDVPRSPQGHPVRVQAGSSPRGRDFAARHAEAIFTAQLTLAGAQEFYGDIRERVASHGRDPDRVKVLPGLVPIVGETEDEALAVHERLERHASMTSGLSMLSFVFGVDMSGLDLDAPLPRAIEEHQAQGHQSRSALLVDFAREHGLTVRELIGRTSGGRGHRVIIGDPVAIADSMQEWFEEAPPTASTSCRPRSRGAWRPSWTSSCPSCSGAGSSGCDYEGRTLRDHYGLERPARA